MQNEYLTVGAIAGVHGLRGEVKVLSKTDFESVRFRKGSHLFVRQQGETPFREVTVKSVRQHNQFWLMAFEDLNTVSDVENWKGMQLCVHQSQLAALPEGTYYIHELIGLQVVATDGRHVGELIEVLQPGANDVYVVKGPLQPKDVLLPAIPECVVNVDLSRGVMTVNLLPGLLEAEHE